MRWAKAERDGACPLAFLSLFAVGALGAAAAIGVAKATRRSEVDSRRSATAAADPVERLSDEQTEQLLRVDGSRRAAVRTGQLVGLAAGIVFGYLVWIPLLSGQVGPILDYAAIAGTVSAWAAPFAESAAIVLPSFITLLGALAVVKVVGWASTFVIGTSSVVGVLAVCWAALASVALLDAQRQTPEGLGAAIGAAALAVFCITVAVAVPELMPFSRAAREKQLDQRAEALAARRPVLSEEARIIRRCAIPLYEGSGASNRLMAWYISAAVAPIVILVLGGFLLALSQLPEDAAAPSETSVGSTVIGMVVFAALGVVALVLLHVAVLAQYRRPRRLWRGVALPAALGTLLLAVIPLMMTAVARQQPGYAWTVTAAAEWIWAAIVWGSVFAPSWIAMPRLGLFGQVAVAAAVDSAERQSRHLQALRRVTSHRTDIDRLRHRARSAE